MNEEQLLALLASIDEWLGNDEPASIGIIDMIIEWREALAKALGKPERSSSSAVSV